MRGQPLLVPDVVAAEYLTRLDPAEHEEELEDLGAAFTLLHTSHAWTLAAARHRHHLHRKGGRFRVPDFWIAVWALLHETHVVTRNVKEFQALGVEAVGW